MHRVRLAASRSNARRRSRCVPGQVLGTHRIDLVVQGLIVVELKAVERLEPVHRNQVVSYLKATRLRLGLLINFDTELLKHGLQRVVL